MKHHPASKAEPTQNTEKGPSHIHTTPCHANDHMRITLAGSLALQQLEPLPQVSARVSGRASVCLSGMHRGEGYLYM